MRVRFRQLFALLLLVIVTAVYLNGTRILGPGDKNFNYLSDLGYREGPSAWNEFLFGKPGAWGSRAAYDSLDRDYEYRKNYGLLDANTETEYRRKFAALAQGAIASWQRYQSSNLVRSAAKGVDARLDLRNFLEQSTPIMALGIVAAAYTGRTMRYRLNPEMSIESRTLMAGSRLASQYFGWRSEALEASLGASMVEGRGAFTLSKALTDEVSLNYRHEGDHAVGLTYSRGF